MLCLQEIIKILIFFLSVLNQTTIVSVTVNCDKVCFILYILHVTHFVRILFQFLPSLVTQRKRL